MKAVARLGTVALALAAFILPALIPTHARAATPLKITMYVFGGSQKIVGPDGNPHDTTVPASVVLKAGEPVELTVINYDEGPHTITAPDMNLDLVVKPGIEHADKTVTPVSTTFTFTPSKKGNFRWYCKLPCDAGHGYWAMSQGFGGPDKEGYMAGEFVVI